MESFSGSRTTPYLRQLVRVIRQAEKKLSDPSLANRTAANGTIVAEDAAVGTTVAPGPGVGEKVVNVTKKIVASGAELAGEAWDVAGKGTRFIAEKAHMPAFVVVPLVIIILTITSVSCVLLFFYSKRRWRLFTRSEKGRELITTWTEHPSVGKYVSKVIELPPQDQTDLQLTTFEEPPAEEGEEGKTEKLDMGQLHFKLEYDFETKTFTVTVIECKDLPANDASGSRDSFVKVFFLGDSKSKDTKVHRCTLTPKYNQSFLYKDMTMDDVMSKWLAFEVYDYAFFKESEQIGEIQIRLCTLDLMTPYEAWEDWGEPIEDEEASLGSICFSLRYNPNNSKMVMTIMECKNLKQMDFGGAADPFVKINFYMFGKKHSKKKTSVKKDTLNPYFNEAFTFEVKSDQMKRCHFILTVLDYDLIGSCRPIGKVAVGPNQTGVGLKHWNDMVENPKRPISAWYELRDPEEFKEQAEEKK